jgi:hypothetical protein
LDNVGYITQSWRTLLVTGNLAAPAPAPPTDPSLMTLRNFDIEQSILAGDITVLLTVGAPRVQLCPFTFDAGCGLMRHPDVGPVS